jgi:hypothetical protein
MKTDTKILVVMAGFFRGSRIPAVTQVWIESLAAHSHQLVLVFDNHPPDEVPEQWADSEIDAIFERHGEYDFGSYKRGLRHARAQGWLDEATHVLLCNDSVLGPLNDLSHVFLSVCGAPDHVYGLTFSYQIRPHLQSFFLMMGRDVFLRPRITSFFEDVKPLSSRFAVIEAYEIGFSALLLDEGFQLRSFVPVEHCVDPRNGELMGNPMAYPVTMVHLGAPVVKIRALREQDSNLNGFPSLLRLIAKRNPALWQLLSTDFQHRRLWQYSQRLGLVLEPQQLSQLSPWLAWLEQCPHPSSHIILPLPEQLASVWAHQWWQYRSAIEDGKLQVMPLEDWDDSPEPQDLLRLASSASVCDWLVLGDVDLFKHPAKLLAQMHRAMQYPLRERVPGSPMLFRRQPLLMRERLPSGYFDG